MAKKGTSKRVATKAAKVLKTSTSKNVKKVAASTLTQKGNAKERTSKGVATAASKVLQDGRTSKAAKSAAGSALAQRKK